MDIQEQDYKGLEITVDAIIAVPMFHLVNLRIHATDGAGLLVTDYTPAMSENFKKFLLVGLHPKRSEKAQFHQGETAFVAELDGVRSLPELSEQELLSEGITPEYLPEKPETYKILKLTNVEHVIPEPMTLPSPGFYGGGNTKAWRYPKDISLSAKDAAPK